MSNLATVTYMYGFLQGQNVITEQIDMEEIIEICQKVVSDWSKRIDIRSFEEEGYIAVYAERKLSSGYTRLIRKLNDYQMHHFLLENDVNYGESNKDYIADFATEHGFVWTNDKFWIKNQIVFN